MSAKAWDALFFVAALLLMVGFCYLVVIGVRYEDRAVSRTAALAFLLSLVMAGPFLVRLIF